MRSRILSVICIFLSLSIIFTGCGSGNTDSIQNIYLAGPFFNETEIKNIEYAENILAEKKLSVFSPMRHSVDGEVGTTEWARKEFDLDVEEIQKADAIVILYYGNYSDSGTAWECGYAYASGKPVIVVHIDKEDNSNLMVHCGCTTNIYLEDLAEFDFEKMPVYEYTGDMF